MKQRLTGALTRARDGFTRQRGLALLGVLLVLVSAVGPALAAATVEPNQAVKWDKSHTEETEVYESYVTVAEHNRSEMSSPLMYYNDNGEVTELRAELNASVNNSLGIRADKIDDSELGEFPRKSGDASALDETEWSTSGQNASKLSVTGTTLAGGVDAVQIATDGTMSSGDTATATYSNFSLNDGSKRVPLLVGNVDTLDTGAWVNISYVESDGDRKTAHINSGLNASSDDVVATQTANGVIWQVKLNQLATEGTGDGTFSGITKIEVTTSDADAALTLTGVDAARKSKLSFGEQRTDTDSDSALETKTVYERPSGGEYRIDSLDSMASAFSDASVYDLNVYGLAYEAELVKSEDVEVNFSEHPTYHKQVEIYVRHSVPAAIDLSHHGLELRSEQAVPSDRYLTYEYAEGTGDKAFSDVSSWSDVSGQLSSAGSMHVYDSTIQPGQNVVTHVVYKVTQEQYTGMHVAASSSSTATGSTSWVDMIFSLPGLVVGTLLSLVGLNKVGG